jgi:Ca-activated chloride channel family protein
MIRFAHPEYLYGLLVLLPLAALFTAAARKRAATLALFGDPLLLSGLVRSAGKYRRGVKFVLLSLAVGFLVLGLANPQIGTKMEEVRREGVDAMILLDVSNSMMAEDIAPNRLDHAKQNIARMLDKLENDRVGMIVFAGQSYLQLPLTTDYSAVRLVLSTIETDIVPVQGTAIGSAIELAMESFIAGERKHKVMILITDGENHEDDALGAAKKAREDGVVIHAIGMGSEEGAPIPVKEEGATAGFRRDAQGAVVLSRLNESMLRELAAAGGGTYVRASNRQDEFDEIFKQISTMEKKEFGARVFTDFEDRYQIFLGIALILLLAELLLPERAGARKFRERFFRVRA